MMPSQVTDIGHKLFLHKLLSWLGIIHVSENGFSRRIVVYFLQILLIFSPIENFSLFVTEKIKYISMLEFLLVVITCYILSSLAWFSIRRQRHNLAKLLCNIEKIIPTPKAKVINILLGMLFILLIVKAIFENIRNFCTYTTVNVYGFEVRSVYFKALYFIKSILYSFVYPTSANLVVLFYCSLCYHCCQVLAILTEQVQKCAPEHFTLARQMYILKKFSNLEDVLMQLQNAFSLPAFCVFTAHFLTSCSVLGMVVLSGISYMEFTEIFVLFLSLVNSLPFLVACLWFAGGVTLAMDRFKVEFSKTTQRRLIVIRCAEESDFAKGLYERPNFVLTGCDILFFTRSSILTVAGTLLTYTLLVLNIEVS